MRAYVEGIHYFKTHRDQTSRILQRYMSGLSWDEAEYLYDEVHDEYQPLPYPSDEALRVSLAREEDLPPHDLEPADFYDVSYLRELEQSGFIQQLYR